MDEDFSGSIKKLKVKETPTFVLAQYISYICGLK